MLTKEYWISYFQRNKNLFIVSTSILLLTIFFGYMTGYYEGIVSEKTTLTGINIVLSEIPYDFLDIFLTNICVDLSVIIYGFFTTIPSLETTFINGFIIGYCFAMFTLPDFLVSIMPHGIFEIPSSAIALTGAFIALKWELHIIKELLSRKKGLKEIFKLSRFMLNDVVLSAILCFILLLIAGLIESIITPILINLIV
ncbi:stage II sporulation protein M [Methanosphaera sp. WGK6]|uniref:stage II sporulation protein M n=1 Tax=Methanosphaera sp. WGK6 TaxID=1561964 RepID=UPI00084CD7C7|nr:stage II sporulation protein M [Methanosphaera sp. WGK6]OED30328.1 hypothetical protein NL43_02820 [Methanosphaera sp. WGK6]